MATPVGSSGKVRAWQSDSHLSCARQSSIYQELVPVSPNCLFKPVVAYLTREHLQGLTAPTDLPFILSLSLPLRKVRRLDGGSPGLFVADKICVRARCPTVLSLSVLRHTRIEGTPCFRSQLSIYVWFANDLLGRERNLLRHSSRLRTGQSLQ